MKKLLTLLLAGLVAFSALALAACNNDESSSSQAASVSQPAPEPEPDPLTPAYLTGLEKGADYPEGQRVAAVMVNNIAASRPYRGLSEADVVVEMVTEGGITRFMGLFSGYENVPETGSVRSLRDQFFRIMYPAEPFIVHAGESASARDYLERYEYEPFNIGNESPLYLWRDQARNNAGFSWEYTAYTDGEGIKSYVDENGMNGSKTYEGTFFDFLPYDGEAYLPGSAEMGSFLVTHSGTYKTQFDFDAATGLYNMSQYNENTGAIEAAIDEGNGAQLAFTNALVLFTGISYPGGSTVPYIDLAGGTGYYFTGGQFETITWQKGEAEDALQFFNEAGDQLFINPGKSYLSVVSNEFQGEFEGALPAAGADTSDASGSTVEP